jgi:hypothetical protein
LTQRYAEVMKVRHGPDQLDVGTSLNQLAGLYTGRRGMPRRLVGSVAQMGPLQAESPEFDFARVVPSRCYCTRKCQVFPRGRRIHYRVAAPSPTTTNGAHRAGWASRLSPFSIMASMD